MRPPSVNVLGIVATARSTTSAGMRATVLSRSTVQPCASQHVERALGVEDDADVGEHLEGRLVDAAHVVGGEDAETRGAGRRGGRRRGSSAASFVRMHSRALTKGEVTARTRAS